MGFDRNISRQGALSLQGAYSDINNWNDNYRGKELSRLDDRLSNYNTNTAYGGAVGRALAAASNQMRPNVLQAGAIPNLRAGAANMTTGTAGALGGVATRAIHGQTQNYAQALRDVVQSAKSHRQLANFANTSSQSLDKARNAADEAYKQDRRQTYAQLGGQVLGLGASYLGATNSNLASGAQETLQSSLANASTPAMTQAAFKQYFNTPTSNAAYWGDKIRSGFNAFSNWLGGGNP